MLGGHSRSRISNNKSRLTSSTSGAVVGGAAAGSSRNATQKSRKDGGSRSRSTNQVGGGSAFQIILPDGTNVTPKPLLPAFGRESLEDPSNGGVGGSRSAINAPISAAEVGALKSGAPGMRRPSLNKAIQSNNNHVVGANAGNGSAVNGNNGQRSEPQQVVSPSSADGPAAGPPKLKKTKSVGALNTKGGGKMAAGRPGAGQDQDDGQMMEPVKLQETPTMVIFSLPGLVVANDAKERTAVEERNNRVTSMLETRGQTADRFEARHTQTINLVHKHKEIQAARPAVRECGSQASIFDIYDEYSNRWGADGAGDWDYSANDQSGAGAGAGGTASTAATGPEGHSGMLLTSITASSTNLVVKKIEEYVKVALASYGCLLEIEGGSSSSKSTEVGQYGRQQEMAGIVDGEDAKVILARQSCQRILSSRLLQRSLTIVERAIKQNLYHTQQIRYRDLLDTQEAEAVTTRTLLSWEEDSDPALLEEATPAPRSKSHHHHQHRAAVAKAAAAGNKEQQAPLRSIPPRLEKLWAFDCALTVGRVVHSMCWCHGRKGAARHDFVTRDLLAVGYGSAGVTQSSTNFRTGIHSTSLSVDDECTTTDGLVLFWSLRNPHHPERTIHVSSGVTALAFSNQHPNLLAVGMVDGSISIFDVHKEDDVLEPILDTSTLSGRHSAPVWQLKWVDKGSDQAEGLVSISTDGRVMEWSTSKGLSASLLMELKRTGNLQGKISNQANGLSFDFVHGDPSLYLVSTEDGIIHKCSVSYNEQYLETYVGHTAPVYRVVTSPYYPAAFLSCGGDWTVKLWNIKDVQPVLSFHTLDLSAVVHDVTWSPHSSTVFASVTGDGRLMIWDLSQSVIDPVIVETWKDEDHAQVDNEPAITTDPSFASSAASTTAAAAASGDGNSAVIGGSEAGSGDSSMGFEPNMDSGLLSPSSSTLQSTTTATSGRTAMEMSTEVRRIRPEYTSVLFYHETPVVAVGDSHGLVTCYRMVYLLTPREIHRQETIAQQESKLRKALYPQDSSVL